MKIDIYLSNALRQITTVGPNGVPPLEGDWTLIDTQYHPAVDPHTDIEGWDGSHTMYHHVRDALYRRGHQSTALWPITHVGDGMPNLPTPPEVMPDGIFSFTSKELVVSIESPDYTPPVGNTSAMVGIVINLAVPGGGRYAYAADAATLKISFGDVALSHMTRYVNSSGQVISFFKGDNLPATGKIKIEATDPARVILGPLMLQASFVPSTFNMRNFGGAGTVSNRAMTSPLVGDPATRFWAAAVRPRWNTGPIIPGALNDNMEDYTLEASALIKGGNLWKPAAPVTILDTERHGGELTYDPVTGVFTFTREYDAGHPTIGALIKRTDYGDAPDLTGHMYMEVIDAVPADFSLQDPGTENISMHVSYFLPDNSGNLRAGNSRDTARVRRVISFEDPSHLHFIEPSDAAAFPGRDAILIYVRGLHVGKSIKFRFISNGMALRAAMGKTTRALSSGELLNVSVADWRILEMDGKAQGVLLQASTNIPESILPV